MIRSDVSVRFADQIEIIYGPGSTLYGQDAISAVINIKTRRPGDATVELTGAYGLYDTKEGYASFARTFFRQSDLPVSVTAYAAARDSDLSNFRQDFRSAGGKSTTTTCRPSIAPVPPCGVTSASTPSPDWSRGTPRCRPGTGRASAAAPKGSGEGGRSPVLFFVPEARWRDRTLRGGRAERPQLLGFGDAALDPDLQPLRAGSPVSLRVPQRDGRPVSERLQVRHRNQRFAGGEAGRAGRSVRPADPGRGRDQLRHRAQGHRARQREHPRRRGQPGRHPHLLPRAPTIRAPGWT